MYVECKRQWVIRVHKLALIPRGWKKKPTELEGCNNNVTLSFLFFFVYSFLQSLSLFLPVSCFYFSFWWSHRFFCSVWWPLFLWTSLYWVIYRWFDFWSCLSDCPNPSPVCLFVSESTDSICFLRNKSLYCGKMNHLHL